MSEESGAWTQVHECVYKKNEMCMDRHIYRSIIIMKMAEEKNVGQ